LLHSNALSHPDFQLGEMQARSVRDAATSSINFIL